MTSRHKLNRDRAHREAMLRNLVTALLAEERLETTEAKAKAVRPQAEKMITLGKRGGRHARRQAMSHLNDKDVVRKLFDTIAARYEERDGGYVRILKLGPRRGDGAPMALIELV